jgi:hypothetical protein
VINSRYIKSLVKVDCDLINSTTTTTTTTTTTIIIIITKSYKKHIKDKVKI